MKRRQSIVITAALMLFAGVAAACMPGISMSQDSRNQGYVVDSDQNPSIVTSGTGSQLLPRIRSQGSFTGRGFDIGQTASGCYLLEGPRLRLTELQLQVGPDLFVGRGAMQDDGRLLLQLSSGARQLRVTGTLAQLVVE